MIVYSSLYYGLNNNHNITNNIMSGLNQDRITKVLSDLKVLSLLTPGKTLSESTMTIIDHKSWAASAWRIYAHETRTQTVAHINTILLEASSILQLSMENDHNRDLFISLETAIRGVGFLKETYKGDYYIISEIDAIIGVIKKHLELIRTYLFNPYAMYIQVYDAKYNPEIIPEGNLISAEQENYYGISYNNSKIITDISYDDIACKDDVISTDNPKLVNNIDECFIGTQCDDIDDDIILVDSPYKESPCNIEARKDQIKQRRSQIELRKHELLSRKNSEKVII